MDIQRLFGIALLTLTLASCWGGSPPQSPEKQAPGSTAAEASQPGAASNSAGASEEIRVLTWNLEWFNDHETRDDQSTIGRDAAAPNEQEWNERVRTFAEALADMRPTVAALQEVENEKVVQDLADEIRNSHGINYDVAFVEGRDSHTGQDVAFLVQDGLNARADRFDFRPFRNRSDYKSLSKHLRLDLRLNGEDVTLVNVHLITRPGERQKQARTLRAWLDDLPEDRHIVVLGDHNSRLAFNETTPNSEMGILRGFGTPDTDDDLWDTQERMRDRSTHVAGHPLDRILLSASLNDGQGLDFNAVETRRDLAVRGKDDFSRDGVDYSRSIDEQDLSDHYPLLVTLKTR